LSLDQVLLPVSLANGIPDQGKGLQKISSGGQSDIAAKSGTLFAESFITSAGARMRKAVAPGIGTSPGPGVSLPVRNS
jgi:hypothetical protein